MGVSRMRASLKFSLIVILLAAAAAAFVGCKSGGSQAAALGTEKPLPNEPEVTFKDLQGKDVSLAGLKGKVVLVNFWATWCEPCQVEIPDLILIQQKYADKGFTILGVDVDDEGKEAVAPFVAKTRYNVNGEKLPFNYPIYLGNDATADKFGGLLGYPTSVLISRDGKQVKRITGMTTYDELAAAIDAQL